MFPQKFGPSSWPFKSAQNNVRSRCMRGARYPPSHNLPSTESLCCNPGERLHKVVPYKFLLKCSPLTQAHIHFRGKMVRGLIAGEGRKVQGEVTTEEQCAAMRELATPGRFSTPIIHPRGLSHLMPPTPRGFPPKVFPLKYSS